jgi:hypothetical protein
MCETVPGRWNEPASAEHVEQAPAEAAALQKRMDELSRGELEVERLHARMLAMCAMCQAIVYDLQHQDELNELMDRIRFHIERLRAIEQSAPSPTELPPRRRTA